MPSLNMEQLEQKKQKLENTIYKPNHQEHVFKFWSILTENEKKSLLQQLEMIDVAKLNEFYKATMAAEQERKSDKNSISNIHPPKHVFKIKNEQERKLLFDEGLKIIAAGKVGLLLLAGGQGTRLGSKLPKGMYDIGLPSHKSLFQIHSEKVLRLQQLASMASEKQVKIPFYIMTSGEHDATEKFFKDNKCFGLDPEYVKFFKQAELPALTNDGKIILENKYTVSMAPNGNGGMYTALKDWKILDHMKEHGVEYVHVFSVDNVLSRIGDPVFTALCAKKNVEIGSKVCPKAHPHEAVGVFAIKNGEWNVVEYSEISKEMAERRDPETNELVFNASNLCIFLFTVKFLEKCEKFMRDTKVHHIARKKIPYADENGNTVMPETNNGLKLELFNFDICKLSKDVLLLEVDRHLEFSPLKNSPGSKDCTPETCRRDLSRVNIEYLKNAGAKIEGDESDLCEISPLLSYCGEGLEGYRGKTIKLPVHLKGDKE